MPTLLTRKRTARPATHRSEEEIHLRHELQKRDELLEKREQEIKAYISILSHEIKTPIVSMRGYANLLKEATDWQVPDSVALYLSAILKNVDRMESLVNDLLTLSGLNIQKAQFEMINLNQLLDDIIIDLYGVYHFDNLPFNIQKNLPVVFGHRQGLRHVFTNLFVNSIKYKHEKRPLEIEVGCLNDEFFSKFFIRDNGVGIPMAARKRVFNMFARAGNKKGVNGSGIGLVIVQRIIEAHCGQIWLESKRGSGATFYFTLQSDEFEQEMTE